MFVLFLVFKIQKKPARWLVENPSKIPMAGYPLVNEWDRTSFGHSFCRACGSSKTLGGEA
jgi:hypothetical protein